MSHLTSQTPSSLQKNPFFLFCVTVSHKRPLTRTRADFFYFFSCVAEPSITSSHLIPFLSCHQKLKAASKLTITSVGYLWKAWEVEPFLFSVFRFDFPQLVFNGLLINFIKWGTGKMKTKKPKSKKQKANGQASPPLTENVHPVTDHRVTMWRPQSAGTVTEVRFWERRFSSPSGWVSSFVLWMEPSQKQEKRASVLFLSVVHTLFLNERRTDHPPPPQTTAKGGSHRCEHILSRQAENILQ
mmetsp:Transcript_42550/g.109401  ORF Transcript_42550/g.109401 Transcript_42550/m.109401 type:complete len:242 (-) Transcript_42550:3588-4313(-)